MLIDPETGLSAGELEIIESNLTSVLDFVLDKDLNMFVALPDPDQFVRVDGKTSEVLVLAEGSDNSTQFEGPTSVVYGRLRADKSDLYATTKGGALLRIRLGDLTVV